MSILKVKNEKGEWEGVTTVKGEKGDPGISPDITVHKNDRNTYQLKINTKERQFTTPNLKPNESAYIGNTDGELGMIDNWFDPEGHRVTPYLSKLPELPRMGAQYSTRYMFENPVTMYVMDGEPNEKGICSWENYKKYEGSEIILKPNGQQKINDYIIYNARPKYEWDTWEEKQLMQKTKGLPDMLVNWNEQTHSYNHPGCPYKPGQWNWVDAYMVATADTGDAPCDKPLLYWGAPDSWEDPEKQEGPIYNENHVKSEMTDPTKPPMLDVIRQCPEFRSGKWNNLDHNVEGNCCGDDANKWGITKVWNHVVAEPEQRKKFPEEFKMTLIPESCIGKNTDIFGNNVFKEADKHRGIFMALSPGKNYTIESLNGDVGIFDPMQGLTAYDGRELNHGCHVNKVLKYFYESRVTKVVTNGRHKYDSNEFNDRNSSIGNSPIHDDNLYKDSYAYIFTDKPVIAATAEAPFVNNTPNKVLKKGEHITIRISDVVQTFLPTLWGIYLFCWNEEDYAGIKVTEGIEPYSVLNDERLAAGATKFNLKVAYGTPDEGIEGVDVIRYEYNIKLVDHTDNMGYVRYRTNEIKKSYDLDEFSLVGHKHTLADITNVADLNVPKMELSTVNLADGVSPLAENTFYFVYEEKGK